MVDRIKQKINSANGLYYREEMYHEALNSAKALVNELRSQPEDPDDILGETQEFLTKEWPKMVAKCEQGFIDYWVGRQWEDDTGFVARRIDEVKQFGSRQMEHSVPACMAAKERLMDMTTNESYVGLDELMPFVQKHLPEVLALEKQLFREDLDKKIAYDLRTARGKMDDAFSNIERQEDQALRYYKDALQAAKEIKENKDYEGEKLVADFLVEHAGRVDEFKHKLKATKLKAELRQKSDWINTCMSCANNTRGNPGQIVEHRSNGVKAIADLLDEEKFAFIADEVDKVVKKFQQGLATVDMVWGTDKDMKEFVGLPPKEQAALDEALKKRAAWAGQSAEAEKEAAELALLAEKKRLAAVVEEKAAREAVAVEVAVKEAIKEQEQTSKVKAETEEFLAKKRAEAPPAPVAAPVVAAGGGGDGRHLMISYQWDVQPFILVLAKMLVAAGYKVWLDVEQMAGSTLEAMASAVEGSAAVLVCMSQRYQNSINCRREGEYATTIGRRIIPLMVDPGFRPSGWLGITLGAKLYYDFTCADLKDKECDFASHAGVKAKFEELIKELGNDGKAPAGGAAAASPAGEATPASPAVAEAKAVKDMSVHDVSEFLKKIELTDYIDSFAENSVDGSMLVDLTDEDLEKELGITKKLHRHKLMKKIAELNA